MTTGLPAARLQGFVERYIIAPLGELMNRRDFLKVSAVVSAAVLVPLQAASHLATRFVEVRHGDQLYRGAPDGQIHVSDDAGQTWRLHTDFGSDLSIQHLGVNLWGQLQAQLGIAGHSFDLIFVKEASVWRTA